MATVTLSDRNNATVTLRDRSTAGGVTVEAGTPMGLLLLITYPTAFISGGGNPITVTLQNKSN